MGIAGVRRDFGSEVRRMFQIMNSPDALEIDQTGAHASNLIPDVRGCFFLNDHGFHKGGMPKVAKINGGS